MLGWSHLSTRLISQISKMISSTPMTAKNSFIFGTNLKIEAKRNHYFKKECETEFVVRLVHFVGRTFTWSSQLWVPLAPERDLNNDLIRVGLGLVLDQMSYKANWELIILRVHHKPAEDGYMKSKLYGSHIFIFWLLESTSWIWPDHPIIWTEVLVMEWKVYGQ